MKKIIAIFSIIITSAFFSGCNKDLEEKAFSQIYSNQYFSNANEAESALVSMYGSFFDLYGGFYPLIAEMVSDIVFPRNVVGRASLPQFAYEPTYSVQLGFGREAESPINIWQTSYSAIEKANWILEGAHDAPMDTTRRRQILGEAYFMRALMHWTLAKNFGDIPVKIIATSSIDKAMTTKATKSQVYAQIYKDLNEASSRLPDPPVEIGRPTKQSAQLLWAKAALYNEDWPTAIAQAQAVIQSGKYSLVVNPSDIYNVAVKNTIARQEVLFACESNGKSTPPKYMAFPWQVAPSNGIGVFSNGPGGGFFAYRPFYNSFISSDKRLLQLDTSFIKGGVVIPAKDFDLPNTGRYLTTDLVAIGKYKEVNSAGSFHSNLFPVLRLADAYLILAEAEARENGPTTIAYDNINIIRQRAGIPDLTGGLSKDQFVDSVLQERSWEFFCEADRWFDLTRTDKFLTVIPQAVNADYPVRTVLPKHKYFPIPQREVDANTELEQNDAWK